MIMYVIFIIFVEESLCKEHNHSYQLIFLPPTVQLLSIYHTFKFPTNPNKPCRQAAEPVPKSGSGNFQASQKSTTFCGKLPTNLISKAKRSKQSIQIILSQCGSWHPRNGKWKAI